VKWSSRKVVLANRESRGAWLGRTIAASLDKSEQRLLADAVKVIERLVDCGA
jgi:hypothetical protein